MRVVASPRMHRPILLTILLAVFSEPLFAQTAQVSGRVTDTSDSVVHGVTVTVVQRDTGSARLGVTNEDGYYSVPALPPGTYVLTAELEGFTPAVRDGLVLVNDHVARADFVLRPGGVEEEVQVTADALLESQKADVGSVVTERSIHELPLNVRDPISLVTLTPGVTTGANFGSGGGRSAGRNFFKANFRVAGGRHRGQDVLLDGAANVTGDAYVGYIPPVDATQEFKVETNAFSAEYGHTTGGILTVVTKSGTNELRGTAYNFYRNDALDATDFFTKQVGLEPPDFTRNQFGGVVGGPIHADRTFFFGSYEGLRQEFPQALISTVPTMAQRAGDFSGTRDAQGRPIVIYDPLTTRRRPSGDVVRDPFPGNRIPEDRWDPVGESVLQSYPEPNQPGDPVTGANNYAFTGDQTTDTNNYNIRVDHQLSEGHRLFGRYAYQRSDQEAAARWPGGSSPDESTVVDRYTNAVLGDTIVLSPTTTAELRVGFTRAHANIVAPTFDLLQLGFPQYMSQLDTSLWPQFAVADVTGIGNGFGNDQPRNTYSVAGQVHRLAGRHVLKAGVDVRALQFNAFENNDPAGSFSFSRSMTQGPIANQATPDAGHGVASLLLGAGSGGNVDHISGLALQRRAYGLFIQDDWRVSPRLTVNLGLRYDVDTGMTERFDRLTWLDLDAPSPLAEATGLPLRGVLRFAGADGPRNQLDTDWNNVAPRVGIAYSATPTTVVRAGYGIFYAPMPVRRIGSVGFDTTTPWVASLDGLVPTNYLRDPFPQGFNLPTGDRDPLTNVGFNLASTTRDQPVGYTQQWSLSLQRQLGERLLVDVAYLGNKGTKLQSGVVFQENSIDPELLALGNQLDELVANPFFGLIESGPLSAPSVARRQLLLPFPQYTAVSQQFADATSAFYHAMVVKAERRASRGLTLMASYVWSKLIDEASDQVGGTSILNFYDRRAERSLSTYDVPDNVVVSTVYDLPFGRNRRLATSLPRLVNALVGDWTVAVIARWQSGFPIRVNRPAVRDARSARLDDPTIERWFDTDVFSPAEPFTFGNVSRALPDVRADGVKNVDMTFSKSVRVDRYRLQLRADVFNLFNRTQFAAPNGSVTSAAFGTVTSQANSPREIQVGVKLYW
ncbi:MAG: hypothetical protein GEV06_05555 [Luteitalea sp.]|nr:hypothetical protein [Luteitalea sp.]